MLESHPAKLGKFVLPRAMLAVIATVWLSLAGGRPLMNPDEARYAEIPREMLLTGDWVIPRLNGLVYLEKPPLQYWATMVAYSLFGVSEWAARLWTVLTSLATLLVVYLYGFRQWSATVALRATGILASMLIFMVLGHQLTLEASLTFFLTLALLSFCDAQQQRQFHGQGAARSMLICWLALAGAVLTKGLIGIVLPGMALTAYSLAQRDRAVWRHLQLRRGLPLFIVLTAPWFVLAALRNQEFLRFFFVHEHLQLYLTMSADRYQPWWYFAAIVLAGSMPWTVLAVRALLRGWRKERPADIFDAWRLIWIWCWVVLVFFSLSKSKLSPYVLPMFPGLAILIAGDSARQVERDAGYALLGTVGVLLVVLLSGVARITEDFDAATVGALHLLRPGLRWIALSLLAGAVMAAFYLRRRRPWRATTAIAVAWFAASATIFLVLNPLDPALSSRDLALAVPAGADPKQAVYSVRMYDHGLTFYWRRPLTLVAYRGELDLGLRQQPAMGIATLEEFRVVWSASADGVAVMPRDVYGRFQRQALPMRVAAVQGNTFVVQRR